MLFYKIDQNTMDFNYYFFEEVMVTDGYIYAKLKNKVPIPDNWINLTEEEFNQVKESLLTPSE